MVSHLEILDIAESLQRAIKTETLILQPVKTEIIEISRKISDKPRDESPRQSLKLDEKTDNQVVVPIRKSGHLLASVMQMIAIDNMYKY